MKRFLLSLLLLFAAFSVHDRVEASGSNTVFLSVHANDYSFVKAVADEYFNNSTLYNYLETSQNAKVLVARVNPYVYRTTYYYTYWGYEMDLDFQQYETVSFKYYPSLGAILGMTSANELVVLLPKVPSLPPLGVGILHD